MLTIENLILMGLCLFLPLSLHLNYATYVKNLELKEKSIILEFALLTSSVLMLKYDPNPSIYSLLIYSIPTLIALQTNNKRLYILLGIIMHLYVYLINKAYLPVITLNYILNALLFFTTDIKKNKKSLSLVFLTLEVLQILVTIKDYNLKTTINVGTIIIVFILYSYIAHIFLHKGNQMVSLNDVLKELEHEKLLRSSISKLTHELKNPIAVCQGYLEMLNLKDQEKSTRYLNIITSEITRSKTIIDEFSSYGKLKTIEKEELDLKLLLEDIKDTLDPLFKKNKARITITSKEEVYIEADYNKLKQVFINLLKNTLEAKKENSPLLVNILVEESKRKVTISVIDNGIGMSEETLAHVSEVFFTTKQNGTGIGLAYSKEVINLHHGTLNITSTLNQGTKITITLPKEKKSEDFNNKNY